ncbi:MAG: hypothetical protein ABSC91_00660 [Candidatus Bathyarchaeia archaeon]
MAHNRRYTLSKSVCKRLRLRGVALSCVGCGKPVEVGQNVISKKGHSSVPSKLYHSKCYENLFN